MQGVAAVMTIHNGMMLSNNILSTVSEALNMSLDALNIRDETDAPIDIGAAVRGKITAILQSLLGAEQYEALTARIAKANRIYQSSVNLLDATYSLFDSARTVAELTSENTGKIGNALRESGAVYENAYNEMIERVNPQSTAQRNIARIRGKLEGAVEVVETITQISGGIVETRENLEQVAFEGDTWEAEVTEAFTEQTKEKTEAKEEAQVTTDINDADFEPDTTES